MEQTGIIQLGGKPYPVYEMPAVRWLQYRLWLMQRARELYQPFDYLAEKLDWIEPRIADSKTLAAIARTMALQIPLQPPADFLRELELSPLGARALASIMVPDIAETDLPQLITEENSVEVAVYLLDHREPEHRQIAGSAAEVLEQVNARRAAAGLPPIGKPVNDGTAQAEPIEPAEPGNESWYDEDQCDG